MCTIYAKYIHRYIIYAHVCINNLLYMFAHICYIHVYIYPCKNIYAIYIHIFADRATKWNYTAGMLLYLVLFHFLF